MTFEMNRQLTDAEKYTGARCTIGFSTTVVDLATGITVVEGSLLRRDDPDARYTLADSLRNLGRYGLKTYKETAPDLAYETAKHRLANQSSNYDRSPKSYFAQIHKNVAICYPLDDLANIHTVQYLENYGLHHDGSIFGGDQNEADRYVFDSKHSDIVSLTAGDVIRGLVNQGLKNYRTEQLLHNERGALFEAWAYNLNQG